MTRTEQRRLARERAIDRQQVPAALAFVAAAFGQGVNGGITSMGGGGIPGAHRGAAGNGAQGGTAGSGADRASDGAVNDGA
jgi:hypothetical protein